MGHIVFGLIALVIIAGAVIIFIQTDAFDDSSKFFDDVGSSFRGEEDVTPDEGDTPREGPTPSPTPRPRPEPEPEPEPEPGPPPIDPSRVPEGFTADDLSPFFEKIVFSSVVRTSRPGRFARFSLTTRFQSDEFPGGVSVTGWKVTSRNDSVVIPQAAELYVHSGIPPQGNIVLERGDRVMVSADRSPVGSNFRLNLCTGYLQEDFDFTPSLPRRCPRPSRAETYTFTSACQDYVLRLSTCEKPEANPPVPLNDVACRAYLRDNLHYSGCVERYRDDPDFFQREWRVFLGKIDTYILDPDHDRLLLFDPAGKLVDEYTY